MALRQRLRVVETEYEAVVQEKEQEIEQLRQQMETVETEHEAVLRERERETRTELAKEKARYKQLWKINCHQLSAT